MIVIIILIIILSNIVAHQVLSNGQYWLAGQTDKSEFEHVERVVDSHRGPHLHHTVQPVVPVVYISAVVNPERRKFGIKLVASQDADRLAR